MNRMRKLKKKNLLDLIPVHTAGFICSNEGLVTIVVKRHKSAIMKNISSFFKKSENIQIHLDENGTSVWQQIDGSKTVQELGLEKGLQFSSEDPKSEHHKLIEFLSILYRNKFIDLKG